MADERGCHLWFLTASPSIKHQILAGINFWSTREVSILWSYLDITLLFSSYVYLIFFQLILLFLILFCKLMNCLIMQKLPQEMMAAVNLSFSFRTPSTSRSTSARLFFSFKGIIL
jgi:hypothetical protein